MARPYNFMLSPLFIEKDRLKLERTFSFSSATMHFLLGIEFDIEGPFKYGVPYLSRDEEHQAREIFKSLSVFADVIIKPDETEALQFVRISQTAIQAWVNEPQVNLLLVNLLSFPIPQLQLANLFRPNRSLNMSTSLLLVTMVQCLFISSFVRNSPISRVSSSRSPTTSVSKSEMNCVKHRMQTVELVSSSQ